MSNKESPALRHNYVPWVTLQP